MATKLSVEEGELSQPWFMPKRMTLAQFIKQSDFVFTGLHGGIGENGTLQKMLSDAKKPYNGSGAEASMLCMNKFETGSLVKKMNAEGIHSAEKKLVELSHFKSFKPADYKAYWKSLTLSLGSNTIIVKPVGDGCSAGIARLFSSTDLEKYIYFASKKAQVIPEGTLKGQHGMIEMPTVEMKKALFEQFITTDKIRVIDGKLKWQELTDWIEITMGVLEENGKMKALAPSLTVALGNILSLEEKFQGGTGINITPPPQPHVKPSAIKKAQARMELVAKKLGIRGYARIDAFMHRKSGELIIIEANSTPALTPSTVIYHQALEEHPQIYPTKLLEKIVEAGFKK